MGLVWISPGIPSHTERAALYGERHTTMLHGSGMQSTSQAVQPQASSHTLLPQSLAELRKDLLSYETEMLQKSQKRLPWLHKCDGGMCLYS